MGSQSWELKNRLEIYFFPLIIAIFNKGVRKIFFSKNPDYQGEEIDFQPVLEISQSKISKNARQADSYLNLSL